MNRLGLPPRGVQWLIIRMRVMRLAGKIAVVAGAGQSPGEGIGNG
jgi:hypothetical protein